MLLPFRIIHVLLTTSNSITSSYRHGDFSFDFILGIAMIGPVILLFISQVRVTFYSVSVEVMCIC